MPYYRWQGVDLTASYRTGTHFARSKEELDILLLQRDIALISCKPVQWLFTPTIGFGDLNDFFEQLAALIQSGVPLPVALRIIGERIAHDQWAVVIQEIAQGVSEGIHLPDMMAKFPVFFTPLMIAMVNTGLETGNIVPSLQLLTAYLSTRDRIRKRLRRALVVPLVTLGFFITVVVLMIVVLVPRFTQLLQSMHRDIPPITQRLLAVGSFIGSFYGFIAIGLGAAIIGLGYRFLPRIMGPQRWDTLWTVVPVVGPCIIDASAGAFFQTLGALVSGGMHVVPSLHLASQAVQNQALSAGFSAAAHDVASGYTLNQAFNVHAHRMVGPEVIAMVAIGEETGVLGPVFTAVGTEYYERLYKRLGIITSLVQPALMIILGLLITALILAVYMPVFSLTYAV